MTTEPIRVDQIRDPGQASRDGAVTVGAASVIVLNANLFRKQAIFVNDSVSIIYLSKGELATLNAGIRLNANGGAFTVQPDATGRIYSGPISAIAGGAGNNLAWTEDF